MGSELSMKKHINKVTSVCYFHLDVSKPFDTFSIKRQSPVWSQFSVDSITVIPYWPGCRSRPSCHYNGYKKCRCKMVCAVGPLDHVTPSLRDLHWLSLEQRIIFELCSLMHCINTDHNPQCLRELVSLTSDIASRFRLRSAVYAMRCQRLVGSSVNGASRLQARLRGILYRDIYKTFRTIKLLNEI